MCISTENTKYDRHLVQLAYLIFNKTNAFMDSLQKRNSKPLAEKTSIKFKLYMREGYHSLRQVSALTIRDSEFSRVNLIQQLTDH